MNDRRLVGVYHDICACGHAALLHDKTGKCCRTAPLGDNATWHCGCSQFRVPDAALLKWWRSLDQLPDSRETAKQEVSESEVSDGMSRPITGFHRDSFFS